MRRDVIGSVLSSLGRLLRGGPSAAPSRPQVHHRRLSCECLEPRCMLSLWFDFGLEYLPDGAGGWVWAPSPVADGAIMVAATPYGTHADGTYGWLPPNAAWGAGAVFGADRGDVGSFATRDLNFTTDATFHVKLPNGTYQVDLVLGDLGDYAHDQMQVTLQGYMALDPVSTAAGQSITQTAIVKVVNTPTNDGLAVRLRDLDGTDPDTRDGFDPNVAIQSLLITQVAPDITRPTVTVSPAMGQPSPTTASLINFTAEFSEPVTGFTDADVMLGGTAPGATIAAVTGQGTTYNVAVDNMTGDGTVTVQVAPASVTDLSDNTNSLASNQATVNYTDAPGKFQFDFGTATSPLETGWTRITETTAYVAGSFGWQTGGHSVSSWERLTGENVQHQARDRDFNLTADRTFAVDLATGTAYRVEIALGDLGDFAHDNMQVTLGGFGLGPVPLDLASTAPGELAVLTCVVPDPGAAWTLTLRVQDVGGLDPFAVIESLVVAPVAPDVVGPTAVVTPAASQAASTGAGTVNFSVTFSEPVTGFALGDLALAGVITGQGTRWNVEVPSSAGFEDERLVLGPLTDLSGNPLAAASPFATVSSAGIPPTFLIDFGTPLPSPLVGGGGAIPVNESTVFVPGAPGWVAGSGTVYSAWRGEGAGAVLALGSALDTDLNYTSRAKFRVDTLAPGAHAVDLVMGDLGNYAHDDMMILLNGNLAGTVSTARNEVRRFSFPVLVGADGILDVDLIDRGGVDDFVTILGMEIV
jgi:hypothetical protein